MGNLMYSLSFANFKAVLYKPTLTDEPNLFINDFVNRRANESCGQHNSKHGCKGC